MKKLSKRKLIAMLLQVKYILACSELSHTNSMLEKHISKKIGTNKITEIATTQKTSSCSLHSI